MYKSGIKNVTVFFEPDTVCADYDITLLVDEEGNLNIFDVIEHDTQNIIEKEPLLLSLLEDYIYNGIYTGDVVFEVDPDDFGEDDSDYRYAEIGCS